MIKGYAAMEAGGPLEPFEYEPGPLGSHEVELQVEHCGICYSDVSMIENEWGFSEFPLIPGHEVIGTLSAVGSGVAHLQVGQRVGLGWHAHYCMTCANCLAGDHNLCQQSQGTIVGRHGGFAEQVRADAVSVIPLPEGIEPRSAGPLFCGGITVFNPLLQFNVKPTDRVGVIGIGGLGHLALQFLHAWGCEVTAFTSSADKQKEALRLGAHDVLNSRDEAALAKAAGRFDLLLSTVNATLDWPAYLNTLAPKGRLHVVGASLEPLSVGAFSLISSQRSISGSPVGSPGNIAQMLVFAARHGIKPVVESYRFDQVNQAIEHLKSGLARYRVVLSR